MGERVRRILSAVCLAVALWGCSATPERVVAVRHADVYCDVETPEARAVAAELENVVESIAEFLEIEAPLDKARVYVFPDMALMREFLKRHCPKQTKSHATCYETEEGVVATLSLKGNKERTLGLLRHEMTHYVLASRFYDLPVWIDEGLAWFFQAGEPYGRVYDVAVKRLSRCLGGEKRSLERLVAIPVGARITLDDYARAWGLVYYIYKRGGGKEKLVEYLRVVRSGPGAGEFFEQVFGESPAEMEPAWREFIEGLIEQVAKRG